MNIADKEQVKEHGRKERYRRKRDLADMRELLATRQGRSVLWKFLEHSGVHKSIWEPSAKIHYNAGVQDFGHYIMAEIVEADQEAYFLMQREAKARQEKER